MSLLYDQKRSLMIKKGFEHIIEYGFYDPIISGSSDGTSTIPHDHGLMRSLNSKYVPKTYSTKPNCTLFVGKISYLTDEKKLKKYFERFGKLESVKIVRDLITGFSRGYAFIGFKHKSDASNAYKETRNLTLDGRELLVEYELGRRIIDWKPRRLGGGLGGSKESGQLRFGGRAKPFGKIFRSKFSK